MEELTTGVAKDVTNTFLEQGVLGAVVVLTILAAGLAVWYLQSIIKGQKAEIKEWQGKYEATVHKQIEENRNLGQVVDALAGQRALMTDMHSTLKDILVRGASR